MVKLVCGGAKKEAHGILSELGAGKCSVPLQPPSTCPLRARVLQCPQHGGQGGSIFLGIMESAENTVALNEQRQRFTQRL